MMMLATMCNQGMMMVVRMGTVVLISSVLMPVIRLAMAVMTLMVAMMTTMMMVVITVCLMKQLKRIKDGV